MKAYSIKFCSVNFIIFSCFFFNQTYVNGQVVINEIMAHPAGGSTDQVYQSMFNSVPTSGHEWVELYNTDPCQSVDISCWTLGGMDGGTNGGGFSFPNGTVIPPLGFIVIGGPNAPNVDFNLNDPAYDNTSGWLWTSGATRWHLPNGDGWLVLYDNTGAAVDGVYWTFSSADPTKISSDATYDGQPQQGSNCGGATLSSAETVFNGGGMEYISPATVSGQSYERTQDGAMTWALTSSPTAKACNGVCVVSNPFSINYTMVTEACLGDNNGSITITSVNGGIGPFTYSWSNSSSSNAITNLIPGNYSVTITDLGTGCDFDTTFSLTPGPNCVGCPSPWNIITSATPNTVCNGTSTPCTVPASVIINEVMARPAGGATDQVYQSMFNSTPSYGHEWVELYNPSPCEAMDLSCYTIGGMDGTSNGGGYSFPAGTTIPPLGFLVIGGPNAPNVDINLNSIVAGDLWTSGATRWHLPNGDGWLAIYNPSGNPVNGVYWTFAGNDPTKISTDATYDGTPQQGSNCGGATLPSAEATFNTVGLDYIPFVTADGQSFARNIDGGSTWLMGAHTSGSCNATCATPGGGSSTCDGTATVNPTNGTAPYTYQWDVNTGSQNTQTATALCAGTYCVEITDAVGCTETICVTVTDNVSNIVPTFSAVAPICSGDPLSALPTTSTNGITGTWSPALNNTATTTYTFTPNAGQCASTTTLTITVNPTVTPTFAAVAPICSGDPLSALPTTSTNGITGTWSPALNNTATTTYTFTPNAGQCASTTTLTITVNPTVTPTFAAVAPICSGDPLSALPTTSTNGITGTWSPAINNTATTTYTFTPNAGQCASTTTLTITVNPTVTPTFAAVAPICSGDPLSAIPTTSTNGITGTWSPALNNTATTTYTFTPNAGQCASTTTLTITVNPTVTPTFAAVAPICSGDPLSALPTTSTNGITGTWSPAINNTATTTYTFTPNAGQCASTTTLTITVNPTVTPTFAAVAPICSGDPLSALPNTSTNGINGTWSPALNNTATTTYTFTPNAGQCASTTTLTITVNPTITPTFSAVAPICSGDPLSALPTTSTNGVTGTWSPALNNTATTTYSFTPSAGQCASTTTLTITVNPIFSITQNISQCAGLSYTFPDGVTHLNITANESYVSNLSSVSGCDSMITTNITVVSGFATTENASICSGQNFTYPDGTTHSNITTSEIYLSTLVSSGGCDSVVTTNLTVNSIYNLIENLSICEGENYTFPDGSTTVINGNLTHTSSLLTLSGCDSIITTQITMLPLQYSTENVVACQNSNFIFPDGTTQIISASTSHISTLNSVSGCDSIVTTNVTMNPVYLVVEDIIICEGEDYTYPDGVTHFNITTDESYSSQFSSISGCDSTILTNVQVVPLPLVNAGIDISVCEGASVTLNGTGATTYAWDQGMVNGVGLVLAPGNYTFTLTGTSSQGCIATDQIDVTVNPNPQPVFSADVLQGCAPLMVNFTASGVSSAGIFIWDFGNGSSGFGESVQYEYTSAGSFDVTLNYTDPNGCNATLFYANYIQVDESPLASFSFTPQQPDMLNSEVVFTNNSQGATTYQWYFGDGVQSFEENPLHTYPGDTGNSYTVTLIASNDACSDTATAVITIQDVIVFYVPNVFTPDGDEYNEIFKPVFSSGFDPYDYHLMIFNRWGELIFESYNAEVGWNGTYSDQGLVLDDVYVWKIDFKESMSDKRHAHYGHVTVLK